MADTNKSTITPIKMSNCSLGTSPDNIHVDQQGNKNSAEIQEQKNTTLGLSVGGYLRKRDNKSAKKNNLYDKSPALFLNQDRSPIPNGASGYSGGGL